MTKGDRALQILLAEAAEYVEQHHHGVNWPSTAARLGLAELVQEQERLTRAQRFGDDDYVDQVRWFFSTVYGQSPDMLHALLMRIVGAPTDDMRREVPTLSRFLDAPSQPIVVGPLPSMPGVATYLNVQKVPDDFYTDLIAQVNHCYSLGVYPAQMVLLRKLMENLVIDVLRRKYGTKDIGLYYDTNRRRFKDFQVLLDNMKSKLADFAPTSPGLDASAVKMLQSFRETGNRTAHTIDVHLKREAIDRMRDDAIHLVKLLSGVYDRLSPAP